MPAISIVGLGYVGAVSLACLARLGHATVGVDVDLAKVATIRKGISPIVEARLGDLLSEGIAKGRITATADLAAAVRDTDVTFLAVGTPTAADGGCDLTAVRSASRAIGTAIAGKDEFHVVVVRCSVPPGTTIDVIATEIGAASGKVIGRDFGVAFSPEFLREGVAIADFFAPPKTVVGASDPRTEAIVGRIFAGIDQRVVFTSIAVAEMVKYADNVWHAVKVAFGNEIGRVCKATGIDSHAVMDIFVKDRKLNLSPYYLRPGFAFGGSCLPKEVRALAQHGRQLGVELPLIESLIPSNQSHLQHAMALLAPFAGQRIGFLGLAFKAATDDLRESPTLDLMAAIAAEGWPVRAFDPSIRCDARLTAKLAGARQARPELGAFLEALPALIDKDAQTLVAGSDVVVVSHATDEFRQAVAARGRRVHVLDLVRLYAKPPQDGAYEGIGW